MNVIIRAIYCIQYCRKAEYKARWTRKCLGIVKEFLVNGTQRAGGLRNPDYGLWSQNILQSPSNVSTMLAIPEGGFS